MKLLRSTWNIIAGIGVALLAALAYRRMAQHRQTAEAWEQLAERSVEDDVISAEAALTQAKLHRNIAEDARRAGDARIEATRNRNETAADIAARWRTE